MATVNLGNIKFNWKGTYNAGTTYAIDDVVSYNGSSYICIQASTGNLPTVTTYWNVMSTAGTNGTDVGTTITTQGDILYRDGSGLQRLAAGTSGYYLKTQGTGANPVWSEVTAGSHTKIAEFTSTSGIATWALDNIFTSTYDFYMIYLTNYGHTDSNRPVHFRFRTGGSSGSDDSGSNYRYMYYHSWRDSGSEPTSSDGGWDNSFGKIVSQDISGSSTDWNSFWTLYIHQPYQSKRTTLRHSGLIEGSNGTRIGWAEGSTIYNGNTSHTGISFTAQDYSTGLRAGNKAYVYGIKY
jgi:hypothetical protein